MKALINLIIVAIAANIASYTVEKERELYPEMKPLLKWEWAKPDTPLIKKVMVFDKCEHLPPNLLHIQAELLGFPGCADCSRKKALYDSLQEARNNFKW